MKEVFERIYKNLLLITSHTNIMQKNYGVTKAKYTYDKSYFLSTLEAVEKLLKEKEVVCDWTTDSDLVVKLKNFTITIKRKE